jgi:hypothetical protein
VPDAGVVGGVKQFDETMVLSSIVALNEAIGVGKANGLAYQTAWRMWRNGKPPVPAEQLPTGTVIVHPPKAAAVDSVVIYARVSEGRSGAPTGAPCGRHLSGATNRYPLGG